MKKIIVITGGIGSGKNILFSTLRKKVNFPILYRSAENSDYWNFFLNKPKKYGFYHEIWELIQSVEFEMKALNLKFEYIFLIGHWREDVWCYSKFLNHPRISILNSIQWNFIDKLGNIFASWLPLPYVVFFLDCEIPILYERIKKYGKKNEKSLSIDELAYIESNRKNILFDLASKTNVIKIDINEVELQGNPFFCNCISNLILDELSSLKKDIKYYFQKKNYLTTHNHKIGGKS